jgi:hypothetical protein
LDKCDNWVSAAKFFFKLVFIELQKLRSIIEQGITQVLVQLINRFQVTQLIISPGLKRIISSLMVIA